jgi:hypothetical protein
VLVTWSAVAVFVDREIHMGMLDDHVGKKRFPNGFALHSLEAIQL